MSEIETPNQVITYTASREKRIKVKSMRRAEVISNWICWMWVSILAFYLLWKLVDF